MLCRIYSLIPTKHQQGNTDALGTGCAGNVKVSAGGSAEHCDAMQRNAWPQARTYIERI